MAKNTTEKKDEMILLNEHKEKADALINTIEHEVISSIIHLRSVYESLEMGMMTYEDFQDLIENSGIETMKRFREKVQTEIDTIPSNKLKGIASVSFEEELQAVNDVANQLKQDYSKYFKYVSFLDGEYAISISTKEEIYENHKEYESKLASELREKHQKALEGINEFFLFLKKLDPNHFILSSNLTDAFVANSDELQKIRPFELLVAEYQRIAKDSQTFEDNWFNKKVSDFVFKLESAYKSEGVGKVSSLIQEMKKGGPEEVDIANSEEVEEFIEEMKEMEVEKQLLKTPIRIYANPNL